MQPRTLAFPGYAEAVNHKLGVLLDGFQTRHEDHDDEHKHAAQDF